MGFTHFLLLSTLSLGISVQAQSCSRPVGRPNMQLKGDDILKDSFPDGSTATFECATGYRSDGGSGTVTCTAGQWSLPELSCIKKNCGSAGDVTNGEVSYPEGNLYGAKLTVKCNDGYMPVGGSKNIFCRDNGWGGRLPSCEVTTCDPPPPISNGQFFPMQEEPYSYRQSLLYICDHGYTLSGTSTIVCSGNGQFDPSPPNCVTQSCSRPVGRPNMQLKGDDILKDSFPDGSTATFECATGYRSDGGSGTVTCTTGQWSLPELSCKGKSCGSAGEVTNGEVSYPEGNLYGAKLTVKCNDGYMPVGGSKNIFCRDNGWGGRLPSCEVTTCDPPPPISNGQFFPMQEEPYSYRQSLLYICDHGYTLSGTSTIVCSGNGQFDPSPPNCVTQSCSRPVGRPNMQLKGDDILKDSFPDGSTATFECATGYRSDGGSGTVTCTAGQWSLLELSCIRRSCGSAGEVTNGEVSYPEGNLYGAKLTVKCNDGYMPVGGSKNIFCLDNGWGGRLPSCEVTTCDPPPPISNGQFFPMQEEPYSYRQSLLYICDHGYTLSGTSTIVCSGNGQFDPSPPNCVTQSCSRPVGRPNMQLKGDDILKDSFPDGSTATFECATGYRSDGGSGTVTCTAGQWSLPELSCKGKSCGSAGEVTNGEVSYPEGNLYGAKLTVKCNDGYMPVGGSKNIFCRDNGWGGRLPSCEVTTCDPPPPISNGQFFPMQEEPYSYRQSLLYICDHGYTLSGTSTIVCSENGQFAPSPPNCVTQSCSRPVGRPNMQLKGDDILKDSFPDGSTATFECATGYRSDGGSGTVTCTAGQWSLLELSCIRRSCGSAGEVTNGEVSYPEGNLYGAKLTVKCNDGYMPVGGSKNIFCLDNGWGGRLPSCEVTTCDPPPPISNGQFFPMQEEPYSYRQSLLYICDHGYTLSGTSTIVCSGNGQFDPSPPNCVTQSCSRPVGRPNMQLKGDDILKDSFPDGSTATFECATGYRSDGGSGTVTCTAGQWSLPELSCTMTTCSPPPPISNGQFFPMQEEPYSYRHILLYICDRDYTLNGTSTIVCSENGQFDPSPPNCVKVNCEEPEIKNGVWVQGARPPYGHKATVMLQCDDGFVMEGKATQICQINSSWSPGLPTCKPQSCSRPVGRPTMQLKGDDILKDSFPDGSTATFECATGYRSDGGSGTVTCTAGQWSLPELSCTMTTCSPPPPISNGKFFPIQEEPYSYSDILLYICDRDYTLNGTSTIVCSENGQFDPSPPNCVKVNCEEPEIKNGIWVQGARPPYGHKATVMLQCDDGFVMEGKATQICQINSSWSPGLPTCKPQSCSRPVGRPNMQLKGDDILKDSFPDGSTATFECATGYRSDGGSGTVTCTAGQWSLLELSCTKKNCGSAGDVTNGEVSYPEGSLYGAKLTVKCNDGYMPVGGSKNIFCRDNGWEGRLPSCEVTTCSPPPPISNGKFIPVQEEPYNYRHSLIYSCDRDYTLNGTSTIVCSENGQFAPSPPNCVKVNCEEPEIKNGVWVQGARPPYGHKATVTLQCDDGFVMEGKATQICQINSSWSPGLPTCKNKEGPSGDAKNNNGWWALILIPIAIGSVAIGLYQYNKKKKSNGLRPELVTVKQ
ncbi:sushi, von Willebrand factor type A, EGF and pentraxin domain-containing protein 1-like isoform X6 [Echeneis naucrates]|uniref:sushi, von Willebrand factor type A, EGF and pentraxin domain-containing protein 1-like isoform X6 n=1 Tax=Echeneis naucrates TaxID=173247 RepID=UPI001113A753|nr:sushi, von Willebrand factor type A, EGF and pentraxin domain-containing protein 1-like isoform X6 [Echeneis naucrates]